MQKGISLFPGMGYPLSASLDYLQAARRAGFTRLFTSLHIPEADDGLLSEFRLLAAEAAALGFSLTADISPLTFRLLSAGLDRLEPLQQLGLQAVRLDFGFTAAEIAAWTRQSGFCVELNASTIDAAMLDAIMAAGADAAKLQACHNYYPRPETGLGWELFASRCRLFNTRGIAVAAFIPSLQNPRGPLQAGLPTLERHRRSGPVAAAKELFCSGLVDAVLFGDPLAARSEIEAVGALRDDCLPLRVRLSGDISQAERRILFAGHVNRLDPGEAVVRSATARSLHAGEVPARLARRRGRGSVTIDNTRYLRYMGELQIVRQELAADERVNVVARIAPEEEFLIDLIRPGMKFRFVEE
ncbi:MAG: MupG family TIM beta-alpha barrel fold protein [Sporomusaceae bacterium]|nr:MupG family TIM beta-alpha barrel fold protein [Sporomusaceae bacterium]